LSLDRSSVTLVGVLLVTLIGGFVALSVSGVETSTYVLFCAGPLMTTVVGAVLSRKVAVVEETVAKVEKQTNGMASATAAAVQAHLITQDERAAEVATDASKHLQRLTDGLPGPP
jgi:uncharacterized membrane protein